MALFFQKEDVLRKLEEIKPMREELAKVEREFVSISKKRESLINKIEETFPNYQRFDENGELKKGTGAFVKEKHRLIDEDIYLGY